MPKTILLYLEIFIILGFPLFLMGSNPLILAARPILLALAGIYCAIVLRLYGAKLRDVGVTRKNFWPAWQYLITPSLIIIATVLLITSFSSPSLRAWMIGSDPLSVSSLYLRLAFYIFGSAPVQELIFRGYLTYRLEKVFSSQKIVLIMSVLVFTLAHVPFKSPIMLVVALLMGIFYALNFRKYRNLGAISLSHGLVGAVLIIIRNFYLPYS